MKFKIIAEIGQNHNGDMSLAVELIRKAKECGADVAKFQAFDARATFPPREKNEWFDYNCKTELTRDQVRFLAETCLKYDIEFLATPFDVERVSWLEEVNVKAYKIASRSIKDRALIQRVSETGKPMIASLGMWDGKEFPVIESKAKVDYLFCVSKYPTELKDLHFDKVDFKKYSGFSDHTIGTAASKAAMSRGALILEKHFTLDTQMYGPDHSCSMTPDQLLEIHRFRNDLLEILN